MSFGRGLDKDDVVCIHIGKHSAIRKDKILLFATWVNFENIMLSEISQSDKSSEPYDFTHM